MCYIILTTVNLLWFVLSLIADMSILFSIVTPKWLISNFSLNQNISTQRPSVGIYTRCKVMEQRGFHCGTFDLDGFATENKVYPAEWKASMFFIALGFTVLSISVVFCMLTCCRQAVFGKSLHNLTACLQVMSGTSVMLAIFLHALGWGTVRVQKLCGSEAEPFYPGDCKIGASFYAAMCGVLLSLCCAAISLKAESSHLRRRVKRRVEEGDRLVCIP